MARKRIGALLEERGLITEFQLVAALSHQRKWKGKLGRSLIELGYLEEQKLYEVLAEQLGLTLVDLRARQIPLEVLGKIPRKEAQALKAVAVEALPEALVVAVAEPDLPDLMPRLCKLAGQPVKLVLGTESAIEVISARIPERTPVAAVQPVKKAFIRNHRGEIEPLETPSGEPFEAPAPLPAPPAIPVSIPASPPPPGVSLSNPPAEEDPIALDEGDALPSAPVATDSGTPPNSLLGARVTPPALPAEAKPALSDDDLWAMPDSAGAQARPASSEMTPPASGAGQESGAATEPAMPGLPPLEPAGGMDLPPPPSLDLADLPLAPPPMPLPEPPVVRVPAPADEGLAPPAEVRGLAPRFAGSESLPELSPAGLPPERPFPEVPPLEPFREPPDSASASSVPSLSGSESPDSRSAPTAKGVPEPSPAASPARAGDDPLLSSLLDDLGRLTAPPQERQEEASRPEESVPALPRASRGEKSATVVRAPVSAQLTAEASPPVPDLVGEPETPPWLEKPHETFAPVTPLPGLMTEDIKAEAVAFQEEIHQAHAAQQGQEDESKLEVAFADMIESRIGKLEEEMRKLRETVESLVLKIK